MLFLFVFPGWQARLCHIHNTGAGLLTGNSYTKRVAILSLVVNNSDS
jgi:hypothetical protein